MTVKLCVVQNDVHDCMEPLSAWTNFNDHIANTCAGDWATTLNFRDVQLKAWQATLESDHLDNFYLCFPDAESCTAWQLAWS